MPELPEVETVRRGLDKLIVGRRILNVEILNEKSFQNALGKAIPSDSREISHDAIGAKIITTRRRAKVLIIDLSSGFSLVIHLKMTGQIVFRGNENDEKNWGGGHPTESFVKDLPDRSTRVVFDLSQPSFSGLSRESRPDLRNKSEDDVSSKLFFNDQRKFGWIKLIPTDEVDSLNFIRKLAPEIADFSTDNLREKSTKNAEDFFIKKAKSRGGSTIKSFILNQENVAGIGNIYADEALWAAKVHPETRVRNLSEKKLREILRAAAAAMEKALDAGGSTMTNYVQADGSRGNYLDKFAKVFRREGKPCPRCDTEIVKIKVAGRGTHICPKCQKIISAKKAK